MEFEVVVVGGGIGGLTAAALLAARGLKVGLFERQPYLGGCAANVSHLGYEFEPGYGLFTGWEPGGIFRRIFAELPIAPPAVAQLVPSYTVRLPDHVEIAVTNEAEEFYAQLSCAFPECATPAVSFYQQLVEADDDLTERGGAGLAAHLAGCSHRFRRFLDVQLQAFTGTSTDECAYNQAASVLNPRRQFWSIPDGTLIDSLAAAFKASGGTLRLNSPVFRLAYGSDGLPLGVDLLNGERVTATRAIVSNLTVWDTYGKLVGMSRTPPGLSAQLRNIHGWGAYLLFLTLDRPASATFASRRLLMLSEWQENEPFDPERNQFFFNGGPVATSGSSDKKHGATVAALTHAQDWFSFHEDHTTHEAQDQAMLEGLWTRLHTAMPELGGAVEVIETATPQTFYESTRRKFGMAGPTVGAARITPALRRPFPNVFLAGDTVSGFYGAEGAAESAYSVAQSISPFPNKLG